MGRDAGTPQRVLAASLDAQGRTREALPEYGTKARPRDPLPYALLLKTGQWAQAVDAYDKALPLLAGGG